MYVPEDSAERFPPTHPRHLFGNFTRSLPDNEKGRCVLLPNDEEHSVSPFDDAARECFVHLTPRVSSIPRKAGPGNFYGREVRRRNTTLQPSKAPSYETARRPLAFDRQLWTNQTMVSYLKGLLVIIISFGYSFAPSGEHVFTEIRGASADVLSLRVLLRCPR